MNGGKRGKSSLEESKGNSSQLFESMYRVFHGTQQTNIYLVYEFRQRGCSSGEQSVGIIDEETRAEMRVT